MRLHIAIDGCIGVGKTTLATRLAKLLNAKLSLEEFEKNPFLSEFYLDPVGNAFETEMQFLLVHYHQLKQNQKETSPKLVTDFTFLKDKIFAETNLTNIAEKEMFLKLYEFLLARLSSPDLIIYLKGSDELIINRICQRSRSIELEVDKSYYIKLNRAYDDFYSNITTGVYVIDADHFDHLNKPECLDDLYKVILELLPI